MNNTIIIMCGGVYNNFKTPKPLSVINGETLIERTIRLLKENGIEDILISANDCRYEKYATVIYHENSYIYSPNKIEGYWVDAYYPMEKPCIYLHGDVYYSEDAIKKILNLKPKVNTFIGNEVAKNKEHKNWGEPFGSIIVDQKLFREGIEKCKQLQDEGKLIRGFALSWELYRVLNGLDVNIQNIIDDTYLSIDDETIDIDKPEQVEELDEKIRNNSN